MAVLGCNLAGALLIGDAQDTICICLTNFSIFFFGLIQISDSQPSCCGPLVCHGGSSDVPRDMIEFHLICLKNIHIYLSLFIHAIEVYGV